MKYSLFIDGDFYAKVEVVDEVDLINLLVLQEGIVDESDVLEQWEEYMKDDYLTDFEDAYDEFGYVMRFETLENQIRHNYPGVNKKFYVNDQLELLIED